MHIHRRISTTICDRFKSSKPPSAAFSLASASFSQHSRRTPPKPRHTPPQVPDLRRGEFNSGLSDLRVALSMGSLKQVSQKYKKLQEQGLTAFLPIMEVLDISRMVVEILPSLTQSTSISVVGAKARALQDADELAVYAAARGVPEALQLRIGLSLASGNADAIMDLWKRLRACVEDVILKPQREARTSDEPSVPVLTRPPRLANMHGRPELLTLVLAALALKNDFREALAVLSGTTIPIVPESTLEDFLKPFNLPSTVSSQQVIHFISSVNAAKSVLGRAQTEGTTPRSKDTHPLISIFANRDVNKAWSIYQLLMDGCEGPNRWCSPTKPEGLEEGVDGSSVYIGEFLWSTFISGFTRCHRLDLAQRVWEDMARLNATRTPAVFNAMIDAHGKRGDVGSARLIWNQMPPASRDVYTYTTMMSAFFQTHHPNEGLEMFEEMKSLYGGGKVDGRLTTRGLTSTACNAAIHGLLICNKAEAADSILNMMRTDGPKPDTVTYNTFLRNYEIKNNMTSFSTTLRSIAEEGLKPDVFTYTTILDVLLRAKKQDTVARLFEIMGEMNVNPNEATYTTIVDSLIRRKGERNIKLAIDLAEKMEEEGVQTNEVTYTSIVAGIRRDDTLSPETAKALFDGVLERMKARGMEPNRVTYNFLIEACLQRGGTDGVEEAMMWFRSIGKDWVSHETYVVILRGMMANGRMDYVQEILDKLRDSGFEPRGALHTIVKNALRQVQLRQSY